MSWTITSAVKEFQELESHIITAEGIKVYDYINNLKELEMWNLKEFIETVKNAPAINITFVSPEALSGILNKPDMVTNQGIIVMHSGTGSEGDVAHALLKHLQIPNEDGGEF